MLRVCVRSVEAGIQYCLLLNLRLAHAGTYTHLSRRPRTRVGPKRDPRWRPTHRGSKNVAPNSRRARRRTQHSLRVGPQPGRHPGLVLDAPRASPTRAARGQTPAHGSTNASTVRQDPNSRPRAQEGVWFNVVYYLQDDASRAKLGLHTGPNRPASRLQRASWQPWLHREDAGCGARRTLQRVRRVARIASAHAVDV